MEAVHMFFSVYTYYYFQPLCITMYQIITMNPRPKHVTEWFPIDRKWSIKDLNNEKRLKVFFMNDCPKTWKYNNNKISHDVIMNFLKVSWTDCFVIVYRKEENPHIRVKYQGNKHHNNLYLKYFHFCIYPEKSSGNWSAIGCDAKLYDPVEPTMVLDFSNMSAREIMGTVIHQFGHALGLGHALMKPDDWKALQPYVNVHTMKSTCGALNEEDLEDQWTGKKQKRSTVNYDEDSIMKFRYREQKYPVITAPACMANADTV